MPANEESPPTMERRETSAGPFASVVVPLDLSQDADRALPVAAALADRITAKLAVVTVTTPHLDPGRDESEIRWHARAAGVTLDRVLLRHDDDVADGILDACRAADGLLCCASHAYGRIAGLILDGVGAELVRRSTAPLLIVGPEVTRQPWEPRSILVCVDGDGAAPLAETAEATCLWARLLDADVEVLQVMPPRHDPNDPPTYPTAERVAHHLTERGITATPRVVITSRDADEVILKRALSELEEPLVIMGAHGRRHHGSEALGRISHAVIERSPLPVLVVPAR
jgi:nucleotide-binding universal stress UspA family protein